MPRTRGDISRKNKYYLPKHRFYELYHWCLQYPEWEAEYRSIILLPGGGLDRDHSGSGTSDPTFKRAARQAELSRKMNLIEEAAKEADRILQKYILLAVTQEDASYQHLRNAYQMPCGRKIFYDRRRRFYWLLDKKIKNR